MEKERGYLPDMNELNTYSYRNIRHSVSRCCSFSDFARHLAREFKDANSAELASLMLPPSKVARNSRESTQTIFPLYARNLLERYKTPACSITALGKCREKGV